MAGATKTVMDIVFIAVACGFFVLTWGFVRLCEGV
jgi:hypothetical protein